MNLIKIIIEGMENRLRHRQLHPKKRSDELFYEVMIKYYKRVCSAKEEGKPLVWCSPFIGPELLYSMDLVPFFPELVGMVIGNIADIRTYFEYCSGWGIPEDICSVHRSAIGMALKGEFPAPDLIINSSHCCDSSFKTFQALNSLYDCPEFIIDAPYFYNQEGIEYYKQELQRLIGFLEEHTHKKLDYDRLEETVLLTKRATDIFIEISELRKAVPTPMHGRDGMRNYGLFYKGIGTEEMISYLQTTRDELRAMVHKGQGAIDNEQYRICWLYVTPGPWLRLFDWMEQEYGAVIAMESFTYIIRHDIEPQKPLDSLARKVMHYPVVRQYHGPVENILDDHLQMLREYKADAAIAVAPPGCKQFCAALKLLQDVTKRETRIPLLVIDADGLDPSSMSEVEFQSKLEEFFERLYC
jgi:benzoyl-CoA reductase/2-hydroxyglutaryl-CoA dehydratase subunit BcrC/BadD/HgdB